MNRTCVQCVLPLALIDGSELVHASRFLSELIGVDATYIETRGFRWIFYSCFRLSIIPDITLDRVALEATFTRGHERCAISTSIGRRTDDSLPHGAHLVEKSLHSLESRR